MDSGHYLVAYLPCHSKSCLSCLKDWRAQIRAQVLAAIGESASFAGLIPLDKQNSQKTTLRAWHALRSRLNYSGWSWTVFWQDDGSALVLVWSSWRRHPEATPVLNLETQVQWMLSTTDLTKNVSSARGLNVGKRLAPRWRILGSTETDVEAAARLVQKYGLTYEWIGASAIWIREATDEQIYKIMGDMA